ncbi:MULTISPECIES: GntR family transcriptional regulator [Cohaesibacter]|uniref:GntR family transcriptional regulator n=1 Tax=Cohaesibacter TaxID=655352 RepID=UPI000DE8BEF2|nr:MULTISPECIES: GntR family transcriptional regulator [Cohaesibacter]TLP44970.1 GntR family transcriptional regulator [Cohaesibacter sp. CAU 1516]
MGDLARLIDHVRTRSDLHGYSATPLYLRVQKGIEDSIQTGLVDVNDALPAEREFANSLGVSRATVRNAVRALVEKGVLVQRHGAGTFVASRIDAPLNRLTSFTEDMLSRGVETETKWLDRSVGLPTPTECEALELMPETPVARIYRLRKADGVPMCLEHAVLPASILPDPSLVTLSLYAWLEACNRRPTRAIQRLSARMLDVSHAHLLEVATGSPCLYMEKRSFLPSERLGGGSNQSETLPQGTDGKSCERPIEFVRTYYRADQFEHVTELKS